MRTHIRDRLGLREIEFFRFLPLVPLEKNSDFSNSNSFVGIRLRYYVALVIITYFFLLRIPNESHLFQVKHVVDYVAVANVFDHIADDIHWLFYCGHDRAHYALIRPNKLARIVSAKKFPF